jgi:cell division septation protein DedD
MLRKATGIGSSTSEGEAARQPALPAIDRARAWLASRWRQASAPFSREDERLTDEEILTILRAAEAGLRVADVCAAARLRVETYYVLKAKYGTLPPLELRDRRIRERRRRRSRRIALASLALMTGLLVAFGTAPSRPADAAAAPAATTSAALPPAAAPARRATERTGPAPKGTEPARTPHGVASLVEAVEPDGYSVQVAAVPDLDEAKAWRTQLALAGYTAYVIPTTLNELQLYRVRVGPFETWQRAQNTAQDLERDGYPSPWITKRP